MCGGVEFRVPGKVEPVRTYFPVPLARLPIQGRDQPVVWGRRQGEIDGSPLPVTGWARQDSIDHHKWDRFNPTIAYLEVDKFMEKAAHETIDPEHPKRKPSRKSYWFDLKDGEAIEALLVRTPQGEERVYVVTVPTPAEYFELIEHERWPKVVRL
ncbi:hypothetical protein [Methylophilus sp. QUAN]|uniref:hypothetical protein n=1 Tax=Methylophilus sp. QUAN TaxID=2781020 RepID=UPI00188FA7D8|nr:hypothetical protein [Methylophilus sp. QUAN]MBF4991110.1 hypothetical protein [Methylophilus sp. QUAN]